MYIQENTIRGSALITTMVISIIVTALAVGSLLMAANEQRYTYSQASKLKSRYVAEAGMARGIDYLQKNYIHNSELDFATIDAIANDPNLNPHLYNESFLANSTKLGDYVVTISVMTNNTDPNAPDYIHTNESNITSGSVRYVLLKSVGYFPSKDARKPSITIIKSVYKAESKVPACFDYAFFINNWGLWESNLIECHGNVRSNGPFLLGTSEATQPTIYGRPQYNGDLPIPNSGGVYAWDQIIGTPAAGSTNASLHPGNRDQSVAQIRMPSFTQASDGKLNNYESTANGTITVTKLLNGVPVLENGKPVTYTYHGVIGDSPGEKLHLYLEGSRDYPIQINGTVVVRGDLIIRGYVTGQGVIYAGRNIYIPQRVVYKNPPTEFPTNPTKSERDAWRAANNNKDLLGLFAKENIVLGNFTSTTWINQVKYQLSDYRNMSTEKVGPDGIGGTEDDKDIYNQYGKGEWKDIDGDGEEDTGFVNNNVLNMSLFDPQATFPSEAWGGNIPGSPEDNTGVYAYVPASGYSQYTQEDRNSIFAISYWKTTNDAPAVGRTSSQDKRYFERVDAILYTPHFLGGYIEYNDPRRGTITFFGSVICRNEVLIPRAPKVIFKHDDRISGDNLGNFNLSMPRPYRGTTPLVEMSSISTTVD